MRMVMAHLAVMFTDIKGYTERTAVWSKERMRGFLNTYESLLKPIFGEKNGTVIKMLGDAFMVAFKSPTDAVMCGIMIQGRLRQHNMGVPKDERLEVKIAIASGDVDVHNHDVFGEPVNLAARIEKIAEAGEVYFSESVYHAINKTELPSVLAWQGHVKGIAERIGVYRALLEPHARAAFRLERERKLRLGGGKGKYVAILILIILVALALPLLLVPGFAQAVAEWLQGIAGILPA